MSKGMYLCYSLPGHESCATHNRQEIVNNIMRPLEQWASAHERLWNQA